MSNNIDLNNYSVEDLKKLGEKVDKEIEKKKKRDILDLRDEFEKMAKEQVGMSAEEVLFYGKRKSKKTVGEPKYANPNDPSQTWTGRGKRPSWYNDAIDSGKKPEQMLIKK